MSRRMSRIQCIGRAFSLIEVLIAILILALGLLGLGAVIPVVVREQRVASEATRGVIAANNARAYLLGRPDLNRLIADGSGSRGGGGPTIGGVSQIEPIGFGVWLEDLNWSEEGRWRTPWDALWDPKYKQAGELRPAGTGVAPTIPLADRLWPDPSSGADPLLVWDFVARRVPADPAGSPQADEIERTIEIAVFVRRLDPAIRVPPGMSRAEVLLASPTDRDFRLAVGERVVGGSPGPTGDGSGDYSLPRVIQVEAYDPQRLDRIRLDDNTRWLRARAAQPGQKLVDNLGNIYTVTRLVDPDNVDIVEVTPPVSAFQRDQIDRVAFTPQIPAAVDVFRITIPRWPLQSPNGAGAGLSPWYGGVGEDPS